VRNFKNEFKRTILQGPVGHGERGLCSGVRLSVDGLKLE
jgi:hypothetical protein